MMRSRVNFYSIELPDRMEFQLSELVRRMVHGRHSFKLIMQKEGLSPLQVCVASSEEIHGLLSSVFSGTDSRCKVFKLDVLRSAGYRIGLELKHAGDGAILDLSHVIHSSMRSLRPDEKLRAVLHVKRLWQYHQTVESCQKAVIAFNLLFAGEEYRLREVFPPSRQRGVWRMRKAWKTHPRFSIASVSMVDYLLPTPNDTCRTRRSFPRSTGTLKLDGLRVRTASGEHPLKVDETFLKANTLLFGGTGSGKSTMLLWLAKALMNLGRSVCVIDPHGTLAFGLMGLHTNGLERGRLLLVDPVGSPLGLNPFEVFRRGGKGQGVASLLVESIGHVVKEAFGSDFWGPRLEYLLNGMISAVAPLPESNFVDVMELINNPFATKELADTTADENTKNFLLSIVPKAKDEWWMSTIDKIGRIIDNNHSRSVLCRRKGNLDIAACIRDGIGIVANLDMNNIGSGISSLIGAMLISTYWILASSVSIGATIIIDEAQLFPAEIIERIASQGRKFGVNVIFASQSPSKFGRGMLATMSSNFENKLVLRMDDLDAKLASEFIGDISSDEITRLDRLTGVVKSFDSIGILSVDSPGAVDFDSRSYFKAVEEMYNITDDSFPSPLSSLEGQLFDVLQIVSMAETQGRQSLSGVEETGALAMLGYGHSEISTLIERARTMSFVQKAHLKLSQNGRNELLRLQGGMLAGSAEHRSMVLALKDKFDSMYLLTYIPRQRLGKEQPDLVVKTSGSISSTTFYVEVEVATKYQLDKRRKKVERAHKESAVPVFVFREEGPVVSAVDGGEFPDSLFMQLHESRLLAYDKSSWFEVIDFNNIKSLTRL